MSPRAWLLAAGAEIGVLAVFAVMPAAAAALAGPAARPSATASVSPTPAGTPTPAGSPTPVRSPTPEVTPTPAASTAPAHSAAPTGSPATTTPCVTSTATAPRPGSGTYVAMILLDVHSSLAGAGITAERSAALTYLRCLRPGVLVGLVGFSSGSSLLVAPTSQRGLVTAAVQASRLAGGNSRGLSGALATAATEVDHLGAVQRSRLLVLTDATRITGTLGPTAIPADIIAWYHHSDDNIAALRMLAQASAGQLATFSQAAQLAASFPVTPSPVSATTAPASRRSARGKVPPKGALTSPARAPSAASQSQSHALVLTAAVVFVAILLAAFLALGGLSREDHAKTMAAQIERYGPQRKTGGESAMARAAVRWAENLLGSGDRSDRLAEQLDLAGIKVKPAEWVVLGCCACLGLAAVLAVVSGSPIGALVGLVLGWLGLRFGLNFTIKRRRSAFAKQLPDVLQLVAGSLHSGFSLPQALGALTRENTQPSAQEFERALAQTRYGVSLETALTQVAERMQSSDLSWAVLAIGIQRQVGGNLAEVLGTTVNTMRERAALRGQVRSLSAEGRLSGYVLILMPIAIGGWLFLTKRSYLAPLWSTTPGIVMVVAAVLMIIVGTFWTQKLVNIEV